MKTCKIEGIRRRQIVTAAMLGATALAAPGTAAFAQEAAPTVDQSTIIVTAQRRNEALEDVPMSVEVITSETMASSGVTSLRDISNVMSGVALNQGGAFPQPTIRGVTTVINGSYENNVAVYIDGLYQPGTQTLNIDLPNVQSVEVLKGPQGTLYGRNATGGAILINTISPGDVWEGKGEITYARFDDKRASGYVAGPVAENVGLSVAGYLRRSDGYFKKMSRTVPGETDGDAAPMKQDMIRAKLAVDITDNFRGTLGYNYVRVSDPRGNMFSTFENVSRTLAPAFDRMPRKLGQAAYDIGTDIETKQHEGSLILELDTEFGQIRSITGYADLKALTSFDFDGSYLNGQWSSGLQHEKTFQQAVDVNVSRIEGVDLIFGGTYFWDELNFDEPSAFYTGTPFGGSGTNPGFVEVPLSAYTKLFSAYFNQKKDAFAVYGDLTIHATDALSINVGGRYSVEKQEVNGRQDGLFAAVSRPQTNTHANFEQFTPRANIRYEIADRTNVYASYSKGFRSGAYNSQIPAVVSNWIPAKQETIDAYEIGFKTAGNDFHFETAAFWYDYKNLQVSSTIVAAAGNPFVSVTNAPKAKIKGIEASFDWKPVENLTIRGGATYLDAKYGKGFMLSTVGVNPLAAPGLNTNADPLKTYLNFDQIQDLSGKQMSRAPDFVANLGADYLAEVGFGSLLFAANMKYTTSYVVTNPAVWCDVTSPSTATIGGVVTPSSTICAGIPEDRRDKQRFRQDGYLLLNASITWTDPSDHFYARIWGNNLTDEKYVMHYTGNSSFGSYSPMAEPMTYGLTAGYKF